MISFIIPAHNEQAGIGRTLQAIHDAARAVGQPYEIIVTDDASTDATAEIARQNDAIVLPVNHRQIAATRNSGGRAARGERLFFVDADTTINPRVVASALRVLDKGAMGGGAPVRFEGDVPLYAPLLLWWFGWFLRLAGIAGGAFLFCTREAFHAVGGFDERLFGAEDAAMSWALRREGRFVLLWRHVRTSGRRMRGIRGVQMLGTLILMGFFPGMLRRRSSVKKVWYDSNREDQHKVLDALAAQAANVVLLLFTLVAVTNPIWDRIPWFRRLDDGPFGTIRFVINTVICHAGLALWPCAYLLGRDLFRQTRWLERLKQMVVLVVCLRLAWVCTWGVICFWPWFFHWWTHSLNG